MTEGFNNYLRDSGMYHFEGQKGIENLNAIAKECGYQENGLRYGSALENFLQDNPGAMQALVDWIDENHSDSFEAWEEETCDGCGETQDNCTCWDEPEDENEDE